ncbi:MAG TPA: SCO1664 family protein [Acidimicrobiia bacterium]|nr:SCO1664 family protein [Acidimicrobiia bacterium]
MAAPGWPQRPAVADDVARDLLRTGDIDVLGRMPWSSNATFLVNLAGPGGELLAIYKPERGERPLWDFPTGTLGRREVAARVVSDALGWELVPDTILRDGPAGFGMMQRFVEHDPEEHYFTLLETHAPTLARIAAFDAVINNADRKGGHVLRAPDGHVWGIDHGVSFHVQWKLRTVIWEFASEPIPPGTCDDLHRLRAQLDAAGSAVRAGLDELLAADEVAAVASRLDALLDAGTLPAADPGWHAYPWPLV